MGDEQVANRLRDLIADALDKNLTTTAVFYADKLVTISQDDIDDIVLLAKTHHARRQYSRALHTLSVEESVLDSSMSARHLAGLCLYELERYDECLEVLGDDDDGESGRADSTFNTTGDTDVYAGESTLLRAAICSLKGNVFERLDNRGRAVFYYKQALKYDPHCVDALDRMLTSDMLSIEQEQRLIDSLEFSEEDEWLRTLYKSRVKKGGESDGSVLASLELEHGLAGNLDILTAKAELLYSQHDFTRSVELTKHVLERDPGREPCLPLHVACLVELKSAVELFKFAHDLVDNYPDNPTTWFAVGCYYYLTGDQPQARRYFSKATLVDGTFGPAWLGFGHSFAAEGEHDQAIAAYRTAARNFRGCHLPLLYQAMECVATNQIKQGEALLQAASRVCESDPLLYNELAVVAYERGEYKKSVSHLEKALAVSAHAPSVPAWEPIEFNLGHAYRKLKDYDTAMVHYQRALCLGPGNASTYSAIGLIHHLRGELDEAVEYYHKALGLRPEDSFSSDMLAKALDELFHTVNEDGSLIAPRVSLPLV